MITSCPFGPKHLATHRDNQRRNGSASVLNDYLVGTGGWAYFQVPGLKPLVAYSRVFNFVEINSTFYQYPSLREAQVWRRLVPEQFTFSIRAHRSLTYGHKLKPSKHALESFDKTRSIADALRANLIHILIPASYELNRLSVHDIRDFFLSANMEGHRIVLEIRRKKPTELPVELLETMQSLDMIHCVDLSKNETPAYESDTLYTRLFGKGTRNIYQPTDSELVELDRKASDSKSEKVVMSFHFVKMYKDAARLVAYKKSGKLPKVTRSTGLTSLSEILSEDATFPTTKNELIKHQGWKLFDLSQSERVRAADVLRALPDKTFCGIHDVIAAAANSSKNLSSLVTG